MTHTKDVNVCIGIKVIPDLEGWVLVIHYYTKRDPTNVVHTYMVIYLSITKLANLIGNKMSSL